MPNDELKYLEAIPLLPRNDATFVRNAIEFLYKENIGDLKHRSLSGSKRKTGTNEKSAMTPEKKIKVLTLFEMRLGHDSIPNLEKVERMKNFNKHISRAIDYVGNYQKPANHKTPIACEKESS